MAKLPERFIKLSSTIESLESTKIILSTKLFIPVIPELRRDFTI